MSKDRSAWIWMPHPGHLIVGSECKFHLCTKVGGFIVSTVGEYFPDEPVREILAKSRGVTLEGKGDERKYDYMRKIGFEDIGFNRKYETMVFPAKESAEVCCPWEAVHADGELDMRGYNHPGAAREGHYVMCDEWAGKT